MIPMTEDEFVWLIQKSAENGMHVQASFGPGWTALTWEDGEPMPEAVRLLMMKRGILNENCEGAGI